jgi:hypothetical protein
MSRTLTKQELRALHDAYGKHSWVKISPDNCMYGCKCGAWQLIKHRQNENRPLSIKDFNGKEHTFNPAMICTSFGHRRPAAVASLGLYLRHIGVDCIPKMTEGINKMIACDKRRKNQGAKQ